MICRYLMLGALAAVTLSGAYANSAQPNLIVIMTDDLGYADVGFNGCTDIPTPHIDSLATKGIRFDSGYVTYAVCGPSRAGFITGRYPQRFGFERNPQYRPDDPGMGLPLDERTIADVLGGVGYTCGVIGKWHLGAHPSLHPLRRGFDFFFGHLGGGHRYLPEELTIRLSEDAKDEPESYRTWILRNHEPVQIQKYLTDAFSDEAAAFVTANKDQPFFLFLAYNAPHSPLQATETYLGRFAAIEDPKRRTYAAMVSAVDDGVGKVLKALRDNGLEENTLIFFLSDNGGPTRVNASRNDPLRGDKGDAWEGGFRVPFVLQWKGSLPAGRSFPHPVSSLDILATIAALSGAQTDPARPLDGVNLVPFLNGDMSSPPHAHIFLRKWDNQVYAVRGGDFKLITFAKENRSFLFNLADDLAESRNLIKEAPDPAIALDAARLQWDAQLIPPRFKGLIHTDAWKKKSSKNP